MTSNAVYVAALVAEDNLKRAGDELFSPPHATSCLPRDHVIHAYYRTGGALRFRFQSLLKFVGEMRPVAGAPLAISTLFILEPLVIIVLSAVFSVRKNIVSRHDFFQFLSGFRIIWISIGMILEHQFPIGAFDFFWSCSWLHAQERIIID